jgi:hypothetical protein
MSWQLSNAASAKRLERAFANRGIDPSNPGFCDTAEFLAAERTNPRFLEAYAEYVEARPYSEEYLGWAKKRMDVAAHELARAVRADGRLGACVDVSGMLGRMLDRLGIWNYVAKTCLTIMFPGTSSLPPTYFYGIDFRKTAAPHAIVVAPPYSCIDVTARQQLYAAGEAAHIPEIVLLDRYLPANWTMKDLAAPEVALRARFMGQSLEQFVREKYAHMLEVASKLPARRREPESDFEAALKYTIVAVGGALEPLEDVTGYKPGGRTALQIFEQDILPKLAA